MTGLGEEDAMELLTEADFTVHANPAGSSCPLISLSNAASPRVSITRITIAPGRAQGRHTHAAAEQIWIALEGHGLLLLADGATRAFAAGEVARFADGDVHGFENTGGAPFVYLSITAPPLSRGEQERTRA
jgi:quercetin dioxygenase-like cupin family protein